MASQNKILLLASCGMNCGICMAYLREKDKCQGCRADYKDKKKTCLNCKIKNCEFFHDKKANFCFACQEFPCDRLKHLDKRYRTKYNMSMIENLSHIKKFGIKQFLLSEKERWACPKCGGSICVHRGYCLYCEKNKPINGCKMINFATFKNTIKMLEKSKIKYWVFGGFALDGVREKITREHADIDIYVHSDDLDKTIILFKSKLYRCYKRENMYFVESSKLKLGIVILTEEKNLLVANGNKTLAKYPNEIFSKDNIASLQNVTFRIVPNEVLALEAKFSKFAEDKLFGTKLLINKTFYKNIKVTKIRDTRTSDLC